MVINQQGAYSTQRDTNDLVRLVAFEITEKLADMAVADCPVGTPTHHQKFAKDWAEEISSLARSLRADILIQSLSLVDGAQREEQYLTLDGVMVMTPSGRRLRVKDQGLKEGQWVRVNVKDKTAMGEVVSFGKDRKGRPVALAKLLKDGDWEPF